MSRIDEHTTPSRTGKHEFEEISFPTVRSTGRLRILKIVLMVVFAVIVVRLIQIQILESPKYKKIARQQYESDFVLPAARGNIYDRNGNVLASNTMFVSLAADPKSVHENTSKIAMVFSHAFGKPQRYYLDRLASDKRFVWLERQVRPERAQAIHPESFAGIMLLNEPKRLYHYDGIAGALLGFANVDNTGLSGIELQCEKELRGTDGSMTMQKDGLGRTSAAVDYIREEPLNGNNVSLSIDLLYQSVAEEKLRKGVERTKAEGGIVVMLNPKTGEILAVAQYPGVNPNSPTEGAAQYLKLRAFTDMFEPGSVFKIVTASAALEGHIVTPTQKFYAEHGEYRISLPGGKMRVIKDTHPHETISFQEAMEVSSNIVMAKVSDLLGAERLYMCARNFGFGIETSIEYPGEVKGELKRPNQWSGTTLNTMAYGYEVGATPLQIALAYGAVANHGILMKPLLVKKITSSSGTVLREQKLQAIRQVIQPQTASTLTEFFEGVVLRGTGMPARIEGVRIAGKTGTSRRYIDGAYQTGNYTATFIGFFPIEDPQVVCLVMLDNPKAGGYTGGTTSAPIFREIAQQIISTGRAPVPAAIRTVMAQNDQIALPDVTNLQSNVAKRLLSAKGLQSQNAKDGLVVEQIPTAGSIVAAGSMVKLIVDAERISPTEDGMIIPDVRGLSARRAANRIILEMLEPVIEGSGIVISQSPPAGGRIMSGSTVTLVCQPRAVALQNN